MQQDTTIFSIHRLVWVALMAALMAVGAVISIPVGPVPISLQSMFMLLAGFILGPKLGAMAMLLYLGAGLLGLPLFTGGKSGLAAFLGPTGGFLLAFAPGAWLAGFGRHTPPRSLPALLAIAALATALTLVVGTLQFSHVMQVSLKGALLTACVPFLPGAVVKCLAAAGMYRFLAVRRLVPV